MTIDNSRFFNLPTVQEAFCTSKRSGDFVKIDQIFYRVISDDSIPRSPDIIATLQVIGTGHKQLYFETNIGHNLMAQFDQKTHRITLYPSG